MIEKTLVWIFFIFIIIYWFQYIDDKKKNIERTKLENCPCGYVRMTISSEENVPAVTMPRGTSFRTCFD